MDSDLRTSLWNNFYQGLERMLRGDGYSRWQATARLIWHNFIERPIDEIPETPIHAIQKIKDWFYGAQWYEVYDVVEAFAGVLSGLLNARESNAFRLACNQVLENKSSGYRFVGDEIAPITSEVEIAAIEQTLHLSETHGLPGVNEHLKSALEKLSDKKNPDYRNSIKESISAVESICKMVSGRLRASLPDAIKALKDKGITIHPALEQGVGKIYAYTSDADGIRHAMTDQSTCDFDDAKYILVSSSAFVNYLIGKATKAGLLK
jgi:hypothetical protein